MLYDLERRDSYAQYFYSDVTEKNQSLCSRKHIVNAYKHHKKYLQMLSKANEGRTEE